MTANVILDYLVNIATYMFDSFAIVYDLGMQPLRDTLIGTFTISYVNPFSNVLMDFTFNIAEILRYFDITGFVFHTAINAILTAIMNLIEFMPFGNYILNMPTGFAILLFSGMIFFVTCLVRLIVRIFT